VRLVAAYENGELRALRQPLVNHGRPLAGAIRSINQGS
jgi:hypothetical protein